MDECFGTSAAELSSAAAALLGWKPDEFWRATPAELALALERPVARFEGPDGPTIDDLKRRFPDD